MRDRHLRHILNRLRHHRNEEASAVKMRRMTFWSIASRLFLPGRTESLSVVNEEQGRPPGLTLCLARVPRRVDSRNSRCGPALAERLLSSLHMHIGGNFWRGIRPCSQFNSAGYPVQIGVGFAARAVWASRSLVNPFSCCKPHCFAAFLVTNGKFCGHHITPENVRCPTQRVCPDVRQGIVPCGKRRSETPVRWISRPVPF